MRKILIMVLLCICTFSLTTNSSNVIVNNQIENDSTKTKVKQNNEWELLKKAIIQQESRGNVKAVSPDGKSCGILQITPICVKDCNQILKRKKINKTYTLNDRFNKEKSFEMYEIIQNNYNPKRDREKAIRIWNGGCNYSISKTNGYYKQVINKFNILKEKEGKS